MYTGTTSPNGSIAGARGTGTQTGVRAPAAPKGPAGPFASHYGPGAAGGAGTAPAQKPMKDKEKKPAQAAGVNMKKKTPMNTAGVGSDDYDQPLFDSEQEPGSAPRKKKGAPRAKITSIKALRDYANKLDVA